jgi:hypothetical protein
MREQNRLDFYIPPETKVWEGYNNRLFGFQASPGDMIAERLQNCEYLGMTDKVHYHPYNEPNPNFKAKVFKAKGRSGQTYTVEVSDVCLFVVETNSVFTYVDNASLTFGGIVKMLNELLI